MKAYFIFFIIVFQSFVVQPISLRNESVIQKKRSSRKDLKTNSNFSNKVQSGFPQKSKLIGKFSNSARYKVSRSRTRTPVHTILIVSIIIDAMTAVVKALTWVIYTRRINKIKAKMQTQLLEFFRKQQLIKRDMCLTLRQVNIGYLNLLFSLKVTIAQFTVLFAEKVIDKGYFEKEIEDFSGITNKIEFVAYSQNMLLFTDSLLAVDNTINFIRSFENMACTYSIDLAGEGKLFKSRVNALAAPAATSSPPSISFGSIMSDSIKHFIMFAFQSALTGTMDFNALTHNGADTSNTLINGDSIDYSTFFDGSNNSYGDLVSASSDATADQYLNGEGLFSKQENMMIFKIVETCLANPFGGCNPMEWFGIIERVWKLGKGIVIGFKTIIQSKGYLIDIAKGIFQILSGVAIFGLFYYQFKAFYDSLVLNRENGLSHVRSMLGISRSPYSIYFAVVEACIETVETLFDTLSTMMDEAKVKSTQKTMTVKELYDSIKEKRKEEANEYLKEKFQDLFSKLALLMTKAIVNLLLPIAYKGLFTVLKKLGGTVSTILGYLLAVVKLVMSIYYFVKAVQNLIAEKKKFKEIQDAVQGQELLFGKMLEVMKINSNYVMCKYYYILFKMFDELHENYLTKEKLEFMESLTDPSKIDEIISSTSEVIKNQIIEVRAGLESIKFSPDTSDGIVLETIHIQYDFTKTPFGLKKQNMDFSIDDQKADLYVHLNDFYKSVCLDNPYFCLSFFDDTDWEELDLRAPKVLAKEMRGEIYHKVNFGQISNVMTIYNTEDSQDGKESEDPENFGEKENIEKLIRIQGYHVLHLKEFNKKAFIIYCRGCNSVYALSDAYIHLVPTKDASNLLLNSKKIASENGADAFQQIEFITGKFNDSLDSKDGDFSVGKQRKVLADTFKYVVGHFVYRKINNFETDIKIQLIFSFKPKIEDNVISFVRKDYIVPDKIFKVTNQKNQKIDISKIVPYLIITPEDNIIKKGVDLLFSDYISDYISVDLVFTQNTSLQNSKGYKVFSTFVPSLDLLPVIKKSKPKKKKFSIFIGFELSDIPQINLDKTNMGNIGNSFFDPFRINFDQFFKEDSMIIDEILNESTSYKFTKFYFSREGAATRREDIGNVEMADSNKEYLERFISFLRFYARIELVYFQNLNGMSAGKDDDKVLAISKSIELFKTENKSQLCNETCKMGNEVTIPSPKADNENFLASIYNGFIIGVDNKGLIFYEIRGMPGYIKTTTLQYIMNDQINKGLYSKRYEYITDNQIFSFLRGFSTTVQVSDSIISSGLEKVDKSTQTTRKIYGKSLNVVKNIIPGMAVVDIIATKIGNRIDKKIQSDVLKLNKFKKFLFNNFINLYSSVANSVDVFLTHKLATVKPMFFETNKIPHFNDLQKSFLKLLQAKSSGNKFSPLFLTQKGIEKVINEKKDSLLFGQAMFNLGDYNYINLKSFKSTFFIPFKKEQNENFYTHKVNICELSPKSIVEGVEIYQLKLTANEEQSRNAFDTYESQTKRKSLRMKSSFEFTSQGKEEDEKSSGNVLSEGSKQNYEDAINLISTIPMSNIGYIEFHITNALLAKENVYMTSDGAKILLERLYLPYFPPFDQSDEQNYKNRNLDNVSEVPGHYFYEFAYEKDFIFSFRLWIHYKAIPEDPDFVSLCHIPLPIRRRKLVKKYFVRRGKFNDTENPELTNLEKMQNLNEKI